jgi:hypothetical protein
MVSLVESEHSFATVTWEYFPQSQFLPQNQFFCKLRVRTRKRNLRINQFVKRTTVTCFMPL